MTAVRPSHHISVICVCVSIIQEVNSFVTCSLKSLYIHLFAGDFFSDYEQHISCISTSWITKEVFTNHHWFCDHICFCCWLNTAMTPTALQWRHNERDGISNHQSHDCLLDPLSRRRSKKTLKLCVTGLCAGNSPVIGEFSAQMTTNAENVSIWWRNNVLAQYWLRSCPVYVQGRH